MPLALGELVSVCLFGFQHISVLKILFSRLLARIISSKRGADGLCRADVIRRFDKAVRLDSEMVDVGRSMGHPCRR